MQITCGSCSTNLHIPDDKLPKGIPVVTANCPKCAQPIEIRIPQPGDEPAPAAAAPPPAAAPEPAAAAEAPPAPAPAPAAAGSISGHGGLLRGPQARPGLLLRPRPAGPGQRGPGGRRLQRPSPPQRRR